MNKKLNAKVQKLNANLSDIARSFSNATVINPDDEASREKYGTVYTIYDVIGSADLDTLLVTKIVHDVLHDSYFQAENTSPIQSLEKAVIAVRDKVITLSAESGGQSSEFNILVAALWGNVLYLVQYGKGGSYLMRDGNIKPIQAASEGNFTVASGVVKDNDVVIVGTKKFIDMYSPDTLINNTQPIAQHDLPLEASALILKFNVVEDFSSSEVLNAQKPEAVPTLAGPERTFVPSKERDVESISGSKSKFALKLPKFPKKNKSQSIGTVRPSLTTETKSPVRFVIPIVAVLFIVSLVFTFFSNKGDPEFLGGLFAPKEKVPEDTVLNAPIEEEKKSPIAEGDAFDPEEDARNKVSRVDAEVFYDIKLVDENAVLSSATVLDNNVVVSDSASGKLFVSSLNTAKFEEDTSSFAGVSSLNYYGGDLAFSDDEGYKVYDVVNGEVVESYADTTVGAVSASYLDFIYAIDGDVLSKYEKSGDTLTGSTWGQSTDFSGAKDMAIAINIYVVTSDGKLVSYLSGERDSFAVSGLDVPFRDANKVIADLDFDYIYVSDPGNQRVVVLDSTGALVRQLKHIKSSTWDDIKAIAVTRDESTLFVVNGTKVFEVDLAVLDEDLTADSTDSEVPEDSPDVVETGDTTVDAEE